MKVGDYVRTKWGYICKIININDFRESSMKYGVEASYLKDIMFVGDEDIIKSSPNIIDLIEVGDYVNGCRVEENNGLGYFIILQNRKSKWLSFKGLVIKSIVTKKQFSSVEYKIVY